MEAALVDLRAWRFRNAEAVVRCQIALAAKPVLHAGLQAVEGHAMTNFKQTIANRQRVIEYGVVREVAHGEAVDPFDGTRIGLACCIDSFDSELADKHDQAKSVNSGESIGAV
jgi:hypothetical protein